MRTPHAHTAHAAHADGEGVPHASQEHGGNNPRTMLRPSEGFLWKATSPPWPVPTGAPDTRVSRQRTSVPGAGEALRPRRAPRAGAERPGPRAVAHSIPATRLEGKASSPSPSPPTRLVPRDGDLGPPPPRDSPTLNPSYALCPVTGVLQPQLKPSADGEGARVRPLPAPQVAPSSVTSHRTRRALSQASCPHRVTQPIPQSLCASQAVWTVPLHRPPCTAICGRVSPRTRSRAWGHW